MMFLFVSFTPARANVQESDISAMITPETPGPLQETTVTLSSLATDLNKALISWSLDGKLTIEGTGKKVFIFTTGEAGKLSTIDVNISILGGNVISKKIIIQPGGVDLLWQATDSYVPRFYRGKALPSSENKIKIIAIPDIKSSSGGLKSSDFSYHWKNGYNPVESASGWGKSSFSFKNNYLDTVDNISVTLSSIDGLYNAKGSVSIIPGQPKIILYEIINDKLVKYEKALDGNFLSPKSRLSLFAVPYFFSASNETSPDLTYNWTANDSQAEPSGSKNVFNVITNGDSGDLKMDVSVENKTKLFQSATGSTLISFNP